MVFYCYSSLSRAMEEAKKEFVKGKNDASIGPLNECKNTFLYDQVKKNRKICSL